MDKTGLSTRVSVVEGRAQLFPKCRFYGLDLFALAAGCAIVFAFAPALKLATPVLHGVSHFSNK